MESCGYFLCNACGSAPTVVHVSLHVLVPALVSRIFFPENWPRAWLIMMLTMLVDLDHLLAEPIYDAQRCSIGFHPLHSYPALAVYLGMCVIPGARVPACGLLIHMAVDGLYCLQLAL